MLPSDTHTEVPRAHAAPPQRRWAFTLGAIGVLALVVGVAVTDNYHVGVFHDDSMYVILARSLATGEGYRYLNLPGAPEATHFPPGYPALLAQRNAAFNSLKTVTFAGKLGTIRQTTARSAG